MLELPQELLQLHHTRRERHDWAASHYPLTTQGLLGRFKSAPVAEEQGRDPATGRPRSATTRAVAAVDAGEPASTHEARVLWAVDAIGDSPCFAPTPCSGVRVK